MKKKKISAKEEIDLITGLIVSDKFIRDIVKILDLKLLKISHIKKLAKWCIDYYKKYDKAPGQTIQDIFTANKKQLEEEEAELIEIFLTNLSERYEDDYTDFNEFYILDQSEKYLAGRKLEILTEQINGFIALGDMEQAELSVAKHIRIERPTIAAVDVFKDEQMIKDAINEEMDIIFQLPGAIGEMVGPFEKEDFFSFIAPGKRGKCLCAGSEIFLADGRIKTIDEIVKNKIGNCISMNKKMQFVEAVVSDFFDNGTKECYRIETRTGRHIHITKNHPLFEFDKKWVSIDDGLSINDYIAVPKNLPFFGQRKMPMNHVKIIAYLLADGGLTTNAIAFTKKEKEIKNDFIKIIKSFGDDYRVADPLTIYVTKGKENGKENGEEKQSETKKMLLNYDMKFCKSIKKEIPDIIFQLEKDYVRQFLNTLFTCDGSIFNFGIEYCSGSIILIRQVYNLLLRFGIVSLLKKKFTMGKYYYYIVIRDSFYMKKFIDVIGFSFSKNKKAKKIKKIVQTKKNRSYLDIIPASYRKIIFNKIKEKGISGKHIDNFLRCPDYKNNITIDYLKNINKELNDKEIQTLIESDILFDKIESIESIGKLHTYDITVPKYHNFVANNICAHNTFSLEDLAIKMVNRQLKVIFFCFEMPIKQMMRRIYQNYCGQPRRAQNIKIPYFEQEEINDKMVRNGNILYKTVYKSGLDAQDTIKKIRSLDMIIKNGGLKVICRPSNSMNVQDIYEEVLSIAHYEGFYADGIIIDYADILAKEKYSGNDKLHQIDDTWLALRSLAQKIKGFVGTATQSSKASFSKDITEAEIAQNIRKQNHVTHMMALNQTPEEKKLLIMRNAMLAVRNEEFHIDDEVVSIYNHALAIACLDSEWKKNLNL